MPVYHLKRTVIPDKVWYRNKIKKITEIEEHLVIREYDVITDVYNLIMKVFLKSSIHPNANPKTGEFCLDRDIRGLPYNKENIEKLEKDMKKFNLLNCYHVPYGSFKVKGGLRGNDEI